MKITHVQSSFVAPLGGAESYVLALATEQSRRGDEVEIVTAWADADTVERARRAGVAIRVHRVWRPYRPDQHGAGVAAKIAFHALDVLEALGPDRMPDVQRPDGVVHVHRFQGLGPSVLRARRGAVVHTAHDYCLVDTTSTSIREGREPGRLSAVQRLRARVIWRAARRASILVFPSERTLARHRALGLPAGGVDQRVVPHGWPAPAASAGRRESARTRPRFVFLGKLQATKGIELLLRAWALAGVDADLVIAGDGPERPAVERAAASGRIAYVGWVDAARKADLIASATALVFPSLWPETFGLVIAESLLMHCPVIATPQAAGTFVRDGENGLVTEGATAEALAASLRRLADDAALRARLARGAAASAAALDFGRHVDRVADVYADAREEFSRGRSPRP